MILSSSVGDGGGVLIDVVIIVPSVISGIVVVVVVVGVVGLWGAAPLILLAIPRSVTYLSSRNYDNKIDHHCQYILSPICHLRC